MAANPEGPFEMAITHLPANGQRQVLHRPDPVRAMATRLQAWRDAPETCQSCLSEMARWVRQGVPLCPSCRSNREVREGGIDVLQRRLVAQRVEPMTGEGFYGYAIMFDTWSVDLGGFKERIRPQAILRTMEERVDVRALWNHDSGLPLGRLSAGTLRTDADMTGYAIRLSPPVWARGYVESVERRDVTGQSFGFRAIDDEWDFDGAMPTRDVIDMRVSETSIVGFPAYTSTSVHVAKDMTIVRGEKLAWMRQRLRTAMAR